MGVSDLLCKNIGICTVFCYEWEGGLKSWKTVTYYMFPWGKFTFTNVVGRCKIVHVLGNVHKLRNAPGGGGQRFVTNLFKNIGFCTVSRYKGEGV
jgi:hypothetical protein